MIAHRPDSATAESPMSAFLSLTSYILHHAYRSSRATTYGLLNLLVLRVMIEDVALCKTLCDGDNAVVVRLCRQRQPFLPPTTKPRPPIAAILDILIDSINHNLRRYLDLPLYISTLELMHRLLSFLAFTQTRISYHWSLLWQTLTSFIRFLTTYASSFAVSDLELPRLLKPLLATLALAITSGELFLPDPAAYDDLIYKLVEAGACLNRFKSAFITHVGPVSDSTSDDKGDASNMDLLIHVSEHYQGLVQAERGKGRLGNNPSPRQISKIIRQGYESLQMPTVAGLDKWDRFREAESKALLKRAARIVADDTRQLLVSS